MTVAIVGSREYPDLAAVRRFVAELPRGAVIVSGGARGVDRVAAAEGQRLGMSVEVLPADWTRYGRSAGMIRNRQIVDRADTVAAFWDGSSKGTQHAIEYARRCGKLAYVFTADRP